MNKRHLLGALQKNAENKANSSALVLLEKRPTHEDIHRYSQCLFTRKWVRLQHLIPILNRGFPDVSLGMLKVRIAFRFGVVR